MEVTKKTMPNPPTLPPQRVAAYCRVSTKAPEQLGSLAAQERYYEDKIKATPNWIFAGVYADVGSGTQVKGRKRFNAMLSACRRGKISMILIKSAHRFARNTVDALQTLRMLRRWKVDVYFEQEDIHSLYESSEFMLTLICGRAQEESYSKSEDIKWGLQKSFENPDSKYYQRRCYGYTQDADGRLVIHAEEARVVQMIYELKSTGASLSGIVSWLKDMGIPSPRGHATWSRETLRKILLNEKYCGNVILQKTFVGDFLIHRQLQNAGQREKYFVAKNHQPIIADKG